MKARTAKRVTLWTTLAAIGAVAAWQAAPALQSTDKQEEGASKEKSEKPKPKPEAEKPKPALRPSDTASTTSAPAKPAAPKAPQSTSPTGKATPMEQRVATIGLLNKRNGLWRDLTMKPGEAIRVGDVVVRLRACETTAPYEIDQYTGAFVQVITRSPDNSWKRVFSGWLYKESPSLNVVEHPIYDVWTKDCQMRHPDTGPDTIIARGGDTAPSSAEKSASGRSRARASSDE
jgi:hypothetical protein